MCFLGFIVNRFFLHLVFAIRFWPKLKEKSYQNVGTYLVIYIYLCCLFSLHHSVVKIIFNKIPYRFQSLKHSVLELLTVEIIQQTALTDYGLLKPTAICKATLK